jgi:hypothetical protein
MMLTAAHCSSNGGSVSTPAMPMGWVTSGSRENWNDVTGTTYYNNQSTYRGDVALIAIDNGKYAGYSIYTGSPASATGKPVREMWSRSPQYLDQYCTGGYVTGELCNWVVDFIGVNVQYTADGPNVWARHVTRGTKEGQCTKKGDSGGPVYTVRSDGGIAAKGVHSGWGGGGGDWWGGPLDPCFEYFTDIWDPFLALPGRLKI